MFTSELLFWRFELVKNRAMLYTYRKINGIGAEGPSGAKGGPGGGSQSVNSLAATNSKAENQFT